MKELVIEYRKWMIEEFKHGLKALNDSFCIGGSLLKYYLAYKTEKIGQPMQREEALLKLMELKGAFNDLCILIYDERDRLIGRIPKKK